MTWLGLDIGGANLKAADGRGWAESVPFALWRNPAGLTDALAGLVAKAPAAERLAITMTGELCDCFSSKVEGVRHILSAVQQVAGRRDVRVYLVDGRFVAIDEAWATPLLAAASNWHALARFAATFVTQRTGLVIDVGSTTTDIIPIVDGQVAAHGRTDTERLLSGELLYRGVGRTPICAVVNSLPWRGKRCPIAAEVFATTGDAHVLVGDLKEDPQADWTADGRPLTKQHAGQRLARQLCADASEFSAIELEKIARDVCDVQLAELQRAIETVASAMNQRPSQCIVSGLGEFLGMRAVKQASARCGILSLAEEIGREATQSAPAYALAMLAG